MGGDSWIGSAGGQDINSTFLLTLIEKVELSSSSLLKPVTCGQPGKWRRNRRSGEWGGNVCRRSPAPAHVSYNAAPGILVAFSNHNLADRFWPGHRVRASVSFTRATDPLVGVSRCGKPRPARQEFLALDDGWRTKAVWISQTAECHSNRRGCPAASAAYPESLSPNDSPLEFGWRSWKCRLLSQRC